MIQNIFKIENLIEKLIRNAKDEILIETTNKRTKEMNHFIVYIKYLGEEYYQVFDINSVGFNKNFTIWRIELKNSTGITIEEPPSIENIILVVSKYFNIPLEIMLGKCQKREVVVPRQVSQYFAKRETKLSFAKIGNDIGGVDHATVMNSLKTVNNLIDTNKKFRQQIIDLENIMKSYN